MRRALQVLSTALFNKPAFKNLVCNGLVLASDGKKMSKRLKNYPVRHGRCIRFHAHKPAHDAPAAQPSSLVYLRPVLL